MRLSLIQKYYANKFEINFPDFRALCCKLIFSEIFTDPQLTFPILDMSMS